MGNSPGADAGPHQLLKEAPPMTALLFNMISLLAGAAGAHLGTPWAAHAGTDRPAGGNLTDARLAIDAANALLGSVGASLASNERQAIEGVLTQLQVEYVKRAGETT